MSCIITVNGSEVTFRIEDVDTMHKLCEQLSHVSGIPQLRFHGAIWEEDPLAGEIKPLVRSDDPSWCNTTHWHVAVSPFPFSIGKIEEGQPGAGLVGWFVQIEKIPPDKLANLEMAGISLLTTTPDAPKTSIRAAVASLGPKAVIALPLNALNYLT